MLMLPLIALMFPAVLLGLGLLAVPPTSVDYSDIANKKARSAYYQTGTAPATVTVTGVTVPTQSVDTAGFAQPHLNNLAWKKINAEQALIAVCNRLMNRCNTLNISQLFAFLPSNKDTVQSLLTQTPVSTTIDCSAPSYQTHGLHLVQQSLRAEDLTHTIGGTTYTLYYNKPLSGTGCFFVDIVNVQ
jgi:hypothetical protein